MVPRQPDLAAAIRLDCVRALYRQIPNSFVAAVGVTAYMAVTMWDKAALPSILWWLGAQGLAQVHRFWVLRRFRRADAAGHVTSVTAPAWAARYTVFMAVSGAVFASAVFIFFQPDNAASQALTMCGLYGVSAGAVPGNAYHPPAILTYLGLVFGAVMLRMLQLGGVDFIVLGAASLFFMLIMMLFCRVQHRGIVDSIRIRYENAALLEQLRTQTGIAEAARARAEQANLAKSRFLAAASHDLRQPLHALGLFSASLRELRLSEEQAHVVERIHQNVDSLEALFDDLLDISRLDAGQVIPQAVDFRVDDLVDRVAGRYEAMAAEKGLDLRVRPARLTARSDPGLCERVLGNLVHNAIRYTSAGGVLIAARARGDRIVLEVWDTGAGIAPDDQARVFEEFFQIGNPERDRRKGMGLGLAIAHRTAILLGNPLRLRSVPGRGSVFRFSIPLGDAARISVAQAEAPAAADALAGRCIVVIDDEAAIQEGMSGLLTRWGCIPVTAGTAEEALSTLGSRGLIPHLIVADFRLRGGATGRQAIDLLRNSFGPAVPALIITGDTSPERLADAARGGHRLLHKPVRPAQLRAVANFLLTKSV